MLNFDRYKYSDNDNDFPTLSEATGTILFLRLKILMQKKATNMVNLNNLVSHHKIIKFSVFSLHDRKVVKLDRDELHDLNVQVRIIVS